MWKYLFCHTTRDYIIKVMRRIVLSCWMMKSADTHWENVPFNLFFYASIITRTLLSVTTYAYFLFVFSILFAPGGSICLLIRHFSRCWTSVIMWCVEQYCDIHKYIFILHDVLWRAFLNFSFIKILYFGFEIRLTCSVARNSSEVCYLEYKTFSLYIYIYIYVCVCVCVCVCACYCKSPKICKS